MITTCSVKFSLQEFLQKSIIFIWSPPTRNPTLYNFNFIRIKSVPYFIKICIYFISKRYKNLFEVIVHSTHFICPFIKYLYTTIIEYNWIIVSGPVAKWLHIKLVNRDFQVQIPHSPFKVWAFSATFRMRCKTNVPHFEYVCRKTRYKYRN